MKDLSLLKQMYRGASLILPLLILLCSVTPAAAQSEGPNRAGLVVVHGDGSVTTRCVSFAEPEISGMNLLQSSGLVWQTTNGPMGSAVCTLDGEGCTPSDCFCQCKQAPCAYWNYFTGNGDGSWTYSGVGVAARVLKNGDIDGWVWGDGSAGPSFLTFETICTASNTDGITETASPPTTSPTPEPTVTPTTTPSATVTPTTSTVPLITASPTPTPTPTVHHEPTSTGTSQPIHVASPTATAIATATLVSDPTPTPVALPSPSADLTGETDSNTTLAQMGAFSLLLCSLGIIYFLQRRRK